MHGGWIILLLLSNGDVVPPDEIVYIVQNGMFVKQSGTHFVTQQN